MKTFIYRFILLLGGIWSITSCEQMEEVHQKYIENGEVIYRAKAVDVVGYSGKYRAKLTWKLITPTLVTKCEIREGDKVLATIPVQYQDTLNMEYTLSELEEKTYTFSIYSLDSEGNLSIKSDVIVEVYGNNYASTLKTGRSLMSIFRRVDDRQTALVTLSARNSQKVYATDIFYKSTSGEEKSIRLIGDESKIELTDVGDESDFKIQDIYQPSETSIDQFPALAKSYTKDQIPTNGSRTFLTVYQTDETTVYGELTAASDAVTNTFIRYGQHKLSIEPGVNEVVLKEVSPNDVIIIETMITDSESKNEYLCPEMKYKVADLMRKIDMSPWEITGFSSQQEGDEGSASHAIDNDLSTFWHTEYSPNQPIYPHYMIADMKAPHHVKEIAVARRNDNSNMANSMRLELSNDGLTWTSAGEFMPDNTINGLQIFKLSHPASGRYFKLTGLASGTSATYMCLSEVNLFE